MNQPFDFHLYERNQALTAKNGELEQVRRDLELSKAELEVRVNERTTELRRANEALQADIARRQQIEAALLSAEQKYRDIYENANEGIFQIAPEGRLLSANPALARIYGYCSPEELINVLTDVDHHLYVEPVRRAEFLKQVREQGRVISHEARVWRKDGSVIWISENCRIVGNDKGEILYFEGTVTDITQRRLDQEALRESEERYALAMRGANDGLFDWNLKTGLIYYSDRWKEMLGATAEEIGSTPQEWFSRVHPDDLAGLQTAITSYWDGSKSSFEIEHRMRRKDNQWAWMLSRGSAIRHPNGKATRMAGSMTDISQRKEAEARMLRDALRDSLTGLPNRALFMDRLERIITRGRRQGEARYAVLFMDLDRFKLVNDSLGHLAGDQLLITFAQRLGKCLRPGDTVARLGGDEFTLLLEDVHCEEEAAQVADRVLETLKVPFNVSGPEGSVSGNGQGAAHEIFISASIGIALGNPQYVRPEDLLRDADTAMYRAKASGKNRHQLFDAAMHRNAVQLLQTESDLRRAIERNEFELHYQPIIQISTGRIRAFESLVRWRHPERGLVSPVEFIPIAEETGLIATIGQWVLTEACRQAAAWYAQFPDAADIGIAVNLSAKQFAQPDLPERIQTALRESNIPAPNLILEITESVLMDNAEQTIGVLRRLKELGVKIYIDDFGTGYSSLAYLQNFPVDTMKIDRSFIARLDGKSGNSEIVRTIVTLAHTLNMTVTAEGVETEAQMAHLKQMACENSQGFLLSRPLTPEDAAKLLADVATLGLTPPAPLRASA